MATQEVEQWHSVHAGSKSSPIQQNPQPKLLPGKRRGQNSNNNNLVQATCFSVTKPIQGSLKDSDFIADRVFLEIAHKLLVTKSTATAATVAIVENDIMQSLPG